MKGSLIVFVATLLLARTHAQEDEEGDADLYLNTVADEEEFEYGAPPEPQPASLDPEPVNFYGYEEPEETYVPYEYDENEYDEFAGEYGEEDDGYYEVEYDEHGDPIY